MPPNETRNTTRNVLISKNKHEVFVPNVRYRVKVDK